MNIENIFTQIPSFIFWKDVNSVFMGCNDHFAIAAGLASPIDIVGKTDYELAWGESHADFYQEGDKKVIAGISKNNIQETLLKNNGKLVNIIITKTPLLNQNRQVIGVIGNYFESVNQENYGKYDKNKKNIALTKTQSDCLFYLAQGMSYKQIGGKMALSWRTVRHYLDTVKFKLHCETRLELIQKALTLNFIKNRLLIEID